jgi:hypothetical protein
VISIASPLRLFFQPFLSNEYTSEDQNNNRSTVFGEFRDYLDWLRQFELNITNLIVQVPLSILDMPLLFANAILTLTFWRLPYLVCIYDAFDVMPFYAEATKDFLSNKRKQWKN